MLSAYQRIILPRPGRRFVFDVTPGASYATPGEVYTCGYPPDRSDIYVQSDRGGTGDRISAWRHAVWHYVPEDAPPWVDPPDRRFGPFCDDATCWCHREEAA